MVKISVIIPVYNVEDYIEGCLKSICNQTLKDIEIICVNDGTPDKSMDIVKKIAKKDNRIKIVNKENGGLSSARNVGLDNATGEYIYFIDSDDQLKENALEVLYDRLKQDNLDTLFFDAKNVYEDDHSKDNSFIEDNYYHRNHTYDGVSSGQELFAKMKEKGEYRSSACLQINKLSLLKDNNIRFVEKIIHEDEIFTLQICINSKRASHISEDFYLRLVRKGSIMSSSKNLKGAYGYFVCLYTLLDHVVNEVQEEYSGAFLRQLKDIQASAIRCLRENYKIKNRTQYQNDLTNLKKSLTSKELVYFELFIDNMANYQNNIVNLKESLRVQDSIKYLIKKRLRKYKRRIRKGINSLYYKVLNKKCVSIIIPVYNCEDYLRECLDSLLNQTLKEIEIICIDDESTDSSYEILQEYAKKDERVKVVQQKHSNAGNARNIGISMAHGDYLLFLDSDDFFDKNLCKIAYQNAFDNKLDVLLFSAYRYNNEDKTTSTYLTLLNTNYINTNQVYKSKDLRKYLFLITSGCPWTKMFSKKFVKKHKLLFQPLSNANDVYFTRSSLALANRMMAIDDKLVYYRINHGKNTQATKHKNPLNFISAYTAVKNKLEAEGVFNDFYQAYLNIVINETVFNYNSTKTDEAKKEIIQYLKKEGFKNLGIDNINEEDIYLKPKYEEFKRIIDENTLTYRKVEKIINEKYREHHNEDLNWDNPTTFTDKMNFSKIYNPTKEKELLTNKITAREWVKDKIGEKYLVPILGIYDSFEDIDFDSLPKEYVIKCNHDSGSTNIIDENHPLDKEKLSKDYKYYLNRNLASYNNNYELHYRDIKPQIIIEKNLGNNKITEIKFLCFDGKIACCWQDFDKHTSRNVYDENWNLLPVEVLYPSNPNTDKPKHFDDMKKLAKTLSKGFDQVRVDLYEIDNKIYFNEMTFTSGNGMYTFKPEKFNLELGKHWKLDTKNRKEMLDKEVILERQD